MVKLGLSLITIALIVGCSSKEGSTLMDEYIKKQDYYKMLQKTEKLQLKENNETKILVTATYMNAPTTDIENKDDEVFIIGLYSEDQEIDSLTSQAMRIKLRDVLTKEEAKIKRAKERVEEKRKRLAGFYDQNITQEEDKRLKKIEEEKNYLDPIEIQIVENNSPLLKGISFVSRWSQFYLVKYKHIEGRRLLLKIESDTYGKGILTFGKVAKYAM